MLEMYCLYSTAVLSLVFMTLRRKNNPTTPGLNKLTCCYVFVYSHHEVKKGKMFKMLFRRYFVT